MCIRVIQSYNFMPVLFPGSTQITKVASYVVVSCLATLVELIVKLVKELLVGCLPPHSLPECPRILS